MTARDPGATGLAGADRLPAVDHEDDFAVPAFRALDPADPDVAWIVRENSRKARLAKLTLARGAGLERPPQPGSEFL